MDEIELYPEPRDVLERTRAYLKERLKEERAEAARYRKLSVPLNALVERAEEDAAMTASLVQDFTAAIKSVKRVM